MSEIVDRLLDRVSVSSDTFVSRCANVIDGKRTNATDSALRDFQQSHRTRKVELLTRQLALERELATLVEDAYALTPEKRDLLRATRPVRDPLDVLEAKIGGSAKTVLLEPGVD